MSGEVLVVGASGLVGTAAVNSFIRDGWSVTAVSRRRPEIESSGITGSGGEFRHLAIDLRDRSACAAAVAALPDVACLVYAASYEKPGLVAGWADPEQMLANKAMLENVLAPLAVTGSLRHVSLMQGTKAYGVHLHRIPLPAREDAPRDPHENFYWLQEDYLTETAASHGFDWTVLRPVGIVGPGYGSAYSTPPVIGVFAAICLEESIPFAFPGGDIFPARQVVDARIVGDALRWAATAPAARGQHFNLTNGEVFCWQELWPSFARQFGLEAAEPRPLSLGAFLPGHAKTWQRIAEAGGLRVTSLDAVLGQSHFYADYTFGYGATTPAPPALVSDVKIRQAGFGAVMNTEETFRWAFDGLIDGRVLPRPAEPAPSAKDPAR
ncbi:MAG: NAD-dependent epimerase/dehydratase family protein [Trebonia sp.]